VEVIELVNTIPFPPTVYPVPRNEMALNAVPAGKSFVTLVTGTPDGNATMSDGPGTPIGFQLFGFDQTLLGVPVPVQLYVVALAGAVRAIVMSTATNTFVIFDVMMAPLAQSVVWADLSLERAVDRFVIWTAATLGPFSPGDNRLY
jgi:hypothetical protein